MKRVVCIMDSLNAGGAETFMMKIYRNLDRQKFQLDFIVCDKGLYDEEVRSMGGHIYFIPLRTKKFLSAFSDIIKIVRDNNYSIVLKLGSSPRIITDLIAAKIGGAKKICVRSCNAPQNIGTKIQVVNAIFRPLLNTITDLKIAPSRLAGEYTFGRRKVKNGNVVFLHNAVDLNSFMYSHTNRKKIRAEFKIDDETFVLGHIGRFTKQKNHHFLLKVFSEYSKINEKSLLLLVGDGELKKQIIEYAKKIGIEKKIIFTGVRTDIPSLLSAMDVLLLPSFYEGMPNTVIEAQATGLPCIISDSITKEANITGLVKYISIYQEKTWVDNILLIKNCKRESMNKIFVDCGYDIKSATDEFCKIVFDEFGDKI